ncbi:rhodanese [Thiohalorhabdus denitrificans]|uniref:Rhodanese-related sulfurtransferase n=1 Tax=Thiohalorhabdus denitrificans TaxID=381306 RepID=A0A0P9EBL2_9GAMM|nr:rhodanese-like domain-containing protein [Thiohalorhabdus denitrificans]KPV39657.1 rhodanese [Thiohalorhabdus denitrificans]SCX95113.1 Rhodanese-related sulfurtransferase [Thiohalorhabdus denitrificans]
MARSYEELLEEIEARVPHLEPGDLPGLEADGALIVDVRRPEEYTEGHILGAVNLPRDKLEAQIEEHLERPHQPVVVYCGGRGRSTLAGWALEEMGVNVRVLHGGLAAWKALQEKT